MRKTSVLFVFLPFALPPPLSSLLLWAGSEVEKGKGSLRYRLAKSEREETLETKSEPAQRSCFTTKKQTYAHTSTHAYMYIHPVTTD